MTEGFSNNRIEVSRNENYSFISDRIDMGALHGRMKSNAFKGREGMNVLWCLASLVVDLKGHFREYDSIVSDDASGRLATLILWKLINYDRKQKGQKIIDHAYFVSGGKYPDKEVEAEAMSAIREFLEKKKLGETLLSTEFIASGGSVQELSSVFNSLGVSHDVASIGILSDYKYQRLEDSFKSRSEYFGKLFYGGIDGHTLHGGKALGVQKDKNTISAHPKRVAKEHVQIYTYSEIEKKQVIQDDVIASRKDIKLIVEALSKLLD